MAYALFEDRPRGPHARAAGALQARDDSVPLDSGIGLHVVKQVLHDHNATLA